MGHMLPIPRRRGSVLHAAPTRGRGVGNMLRLPSIQIKFTIDDELCHHSTNRVNYDKQLPP